MITVRPVIIDASVCYGVPSKVPGKTKWEILHEDADHARGWRTIDGGMTKLADPSITDVEAFLCCDVLFSATVHPKHGHFAWDKEDIPKRIYIHPDTHDTFYMQGITGQFIDSTRVRPKRVTRNKNPYYIDPRDKSVIHSAPWILIDRKAERKQYEEDLKWAKQHGWGEKPVFEPAVADLTIGDHEYLRTSGGFVGKGDSGDIRVFDEEMNEVPLRIFSETVFGLYDMGWKATGITNLFTIIEMMANDKA